MLSSYLQAGAACRGTGGEEAAVRRSPLGYRSEQVASLVRVMRLCEAQHIYIDGQRK